MSKSHTILLTINNESGYPLTFVDDWFDSGRLADDTKFPAIIEHLAVRTIECYEKDMVIGVGCSGLCIYKFRGVDVTIAFSNPMSLGGENKLGIGTGGHRVYDNMSSHEYKPFTEKLVIAGETYEVKCECTGGPVNKASVLISRPKW